MRGTVVKIDLCGSKGHIDHSNDREVARLENFRALVASAKSAFPYSAESYPKGSYYRSEGDATYFILEKPSVALRSAVEFSKAWFSGVPKRPDCRVVIATAEIQSAESGEFISEAFESISVAEKTAKPGEVLVDSPTQQLSDPTMFQFVRQRTVTITDTREVDFALLNYEDPRIAKDSALVHAVFVADRKSTEARERSYEVLALEYLESQRTPHGTLSLFQDFLRDKGCPRIDQTALRKIFSTSSLVKVADDQTISIQDGVAKVLVAWRHAYDEAKSSAVNAICDAIAAVVGLKSTIVADKVDVANLTESFISVVFMEVRMMANYYKSTEQFFERLTVISDYDYIIRRRLRSLNATPEQELLLKTTFLRALRGLTDTRNGYIAAVFHNVLLLYYLNRNDRYTKRQAELIRSKKFYLDTNTLYAYLVSASEFHDFVVYAISRLHRLGATITVFDRSVAEYNDSLFSALSREGRTRGFGFEFVTDRPWIWQEFVSDTVKYQNEFAYCVRIHTMPPKLFSSTPVVAGEIERALKPHGLQLEIMSPFKEPAELDQIYTAVKEAKERRLPTGHGSYYVDEPAGFEAKVTHDANCISALRCDGDSPYDTSNVFVTCDFRLARVRRTLPLSNFIATITEFQEFITPYLLIADRYESSHIEVPNLLLSASIDLELAHTADFSALVGRYLRSSDEENQDYDLLSSVKNRSRFHEIAAKLEKAEDEGNPDLEKAAWLDARSAVKTLTSEIALDLGRLMAKTEIETKDAEISELKRKLADTQQKLTVAQKKGKGRQHYERAQQRKRHK